MPFSFNQELLIQAVLKLAETAWGNGRWQTKPAHPLLGDWLDYLSNRVSLVILRRCCFIKRLAASQRNARWFPSCFVTQTLGYNLITRESGETKVYAFLSLYRELAQARSSTLLAPLCHAESKQAAFGSAFRDSQEIWKCARTKAAPISNEAVAAN